MRNSVSARGAVLTWNINPTVTGIEFTIPPAQKIDMVFREYMRSRIRHLLAFWSEYKDSILKYWTNDDIRFTMVDKQPAYTVSAHNPSKPSRRKTILIEDDDLRLAWEFDRTLLTILDETRLMENILKNSIWALKANIFTKPKITKETLAEYEDALNTILEFKEALKQWREHRLTDPQLPTWVLSLDLEDYIYKGSQ